MHLKTNYQIECANAVIYLFTGFFLYHTTKKKKNVNNKFQEKKLKE